MSRNRFLPRVTQLEDRTLPATLTVLNLNDAGPGSLRQAVSKANLTLFSADTIKFAPGLTGTLTLNSQLSVFTDVNFVGPGADKITISGNDRTRLFAVAGPLTDVAISGLTLAHGKAASGGGIVNTTAKLVLTRVVMDGNVAAPNGGDARGGALLNLGGSVTISQSTFSANQAKGAPLGGVARGGAIHNVLGKLTADKVTFIGNVARGGDGGTGGINILRGSAAGGALGNSLGGTVTLTNSTLKENRAQGGSGGTGGIGLYTVGMGVGGAIENEGRLIVQSTAFDGNQALGGSNGTAGGPAKPNYGLIGVGGGGAIANLFTGNATINASTFGNNVARGGNGNQGNLGPYFIGSGIGGAIANLVGGQLTIQRLSTIVGNRAQGGDTSSGQGGQGAGGGFITFAGVSRVFDTDFRENVSQGGAGAPGGTGGDSAGGGLTNSFAGRTHLVGGSFTNNKSLGGLGGAGGNGGIAGAGAINDSYQANLIVQGTTVSNNLARGGDAGSGGTGGSGQGGAIEVETGAIFQMSGATISTNQALGGTGGSGGNGGTGLGGGFYVNVQTDVTLRTSSVTANQATGGAAGAGGNVGPGIGGGLNIATGAVVKKDAATLVSGNTATTSNNDVFGTVVLI